MILNIIYMKKYWTKTCRVLIINSTMKTEHQYFYVKSSMGLWHINRSDGVIKYAETTQQQSKGLCIVF